MAVSRIYPHTITLWRKLDEGRSANWERLIVQQCRVFEDQGEKVSTSGNQPGRSLTVLIHGDEYSIAHGDRILVGERDGERPPADSFVVQIVKVVRLHGGIHHYEVQAS